ncbi:hypothetical protein FS842_007770 [Serendipita sp. 407]|nr:hypothetical protein FS842_007770 [Serendipita sp. 407]
MKAIISALFSASLVSGAIHGLQGIRGDGSENIVPNAFIVELEGASILEEFGGNIKRSPVAKGNGILYQSLKERGVHFDVTKEWATDVFTAVSLVLNVSTKLSLSLYVRD